MIAQSLNIAANLLVFALPWILLATAFGSFIAYRRLRYQYFEIRPKLFEIKLPPEVYKSPKAMELILKPLWNKSYGTYLENFYDGRVPPHYSLEIVSQEGLIRFFIWVPSKFANSAVNQFYSQYPSVEVVEMEEDYTKGIVRDPNKYSMWGANFQITKSDVIPLTLYRDFQLDDNPKEEVKIDPFSAVMEFLGSLKYGEQAWIQFVIRANYAKTWKTSEALPFTKPKPSLKDRYEEHIKKIKDANKVKQVDPVSGQESTGAFSFEPSVADEIKLLRDLQAQYHFDTYIRAFYIAKKESFNGINIPSLIGTMQQFGSPNSNSFMPVPNTDLEDPQKDLSRLSKRVKRWGEKKKAEAEKEYLAVYKRRSGFYPPHTYHGHKPFALTTEEIATMFHLPGTVVSTPTLQRIDARKADPPTDLPV